MKRNGGKKLYSRTCAIFAILFCIFLVSACANYDIDTDEGLTNCITQRRDLSKAIPKLKERISNKELLEQNGKALYDIYMDENLKAFDRDVITILAAIPKADPEFVKAFEKAAASDDQKQAQQAAFAAKEGKFENVVEILVNNYSKFTNPETRRIVLEAGTTVKSPAMGKIAMDILDKELEDAPIAELRASCNVLGFQAMSSSAETLFEASFHADATGRTIAVECQKALLNLKKDDVVPVLIEAFQLKNEDLNKYVEQHPERMTPDAILLKAATSLGKYRAKEAVDPMLDYLADKNVINPPGALTFKPIEDPGWPSWGMLVGQATQETILALNDIGLEGNMRAGQILYDIFKWNGDYEKKYKRVIDFSGAGNIEISLRVNAVKALAENHLISPEMMENIIATLKDESFDDNSRQRPAARASLARDMVTYFGITSKPGQLETVWKKFNEMISKEFECENQELPGDKTKVCLNKQKYDFKPVIDRIADVQSCFEMADQCDGGMKCFEGRLSCPIDESTKTEKCAADKNFERIKAVYELGRSGNHEYFALILNNIKKFDSFGLLYVAGALASLGTKDDIKSVEETLAKLKKEMSSMTYKPVEDYLTALIVTLNNK